MSAVLEALHKAAGREDLTEPAAAAALGEILAGEVSPALIGGLLIALHMKGESVAEITGFARAMRAAASPVRPKTADPAALVDTCGTGGDGSATFNISTAASFVVAGAGVPVAKHGNRSASSKCGAADVLEELGVDVELTAEQSAGAIDQVGIGFLYAPAIHPAMRHVGPVRRELKMRTVFNLLGPLTNPAGAGAQVVGVFAAEWVPVVAGVLAELGLRRAFVVHGEDGLDEITTTAETRVAEVAGGTVREYTLAPEGFGVERAQPAELSGGDRETNARIITGVLKGEHGPARDIVLVNAAAALVAAGAADDFAGGMRLARESVDSGSAGDRLGALAAYSVQVRAGAAG